jgi:hypothetical protein
VEVFLTNGNGVAWNADPVFRALLEQFDAEQAVRAILAFTNETIASKLQFALCRQQWVELVGVMRPKVTAAAALELVDAIEVFAGPLEHLKDDERIKRQVAYLRTALLK